MNGKLTEFAARPDGLTTGATVASGMAERRPDLDTWRRRIALLDYAFQPIVDVQTGVTLGFEALLRGYDSAAFPTCAKFFDHAEADKVLFEVSLLLWEKALRKLRTANPGPQVKLFFNLDNRIFNGLMDIAGQHAEIAVANGFAASCLCFEVSEHQPIASFSAYSGDIANLKQTNFKIAIDDFGSGHANLVLLFHTEPNYIKIDRFFIAGIEQSSKKRLYVNRVLNLAHTLGIAVMAEGVETEAEFRVCYYLGCDYAQGYWIQRPVTDMNLLQPVYEGVRSLVHGHRRREGGDEVRVAQTTEYITPLVLEDTSMDTVFDAFKQDTARTFLPVVNHAREPLGIIREKSLKQYAFSKFGRDLLKNPFSGRSVTHFLSACPMAEVTTSVDILLEMVSMDQECEGIILKDKGVYAGFLSAQALLKLVHERHVASAQELNPLTKLPGNNRICAYLESALQAGSGGHVLCYFDIDHFKPFNDHYGFRRGDRVIQLLADGLKAPASQGRFFIGHIGGDDFFAAFAYGNREESAVIMTVIENIVQRFAADAASLYDAEDRRRGHIRAVGRDGQIRDFPLLNVSCATIVIPPEHALLTLDGIAAKLAEIKKEAKAAAGHVASGAL